MKKVSILLILPLFSLILVGCSASNISSSPVDSSNISYVSSTINSQQTNLTEISSTSSSEDSASSSTYVDIYEERRISFGIPENYVEKSGWYSEHDKVAAYIAIYHTTPENFVEKMTKPGQCRLAGVHYNREKRLPTYLTYTEIYVDTTYGQSPGRNRIVFSNNYRIFFTNNHYESFTEYIGYNNYTSNYQ